MVRWQSNTKERESIKAYQLCGWWDSTISYTESYAWITQKEAQKLCPNKSDSVKAGVTLYQPDDLDRQAALLLKDLGFPNINFTTNLSYNKVQIKQADEVAMPYFIVNIFVTLCCILMIFNIIHISAKQNIKFYKLLKSLGMTPRQIRHLTMQQTAFLCLPSVPIGWFLGFLLTLIAGPLTIIGMEDENPALFYLRMTPYLESSFLTYITTLIACLLPFLHIARLSPAQIEEYNILKLKQKKPRQKIFCSQRRRTITIVKMAYNSIKKDKRHVFLSYIVLFLSLMFLCSAWTQYQSYNEDIYVTSTSTSDYLLTDSTAINNQLRYNPRNHSITLDIMKKLQAHPALKKIGVLKSQELQMKADNVQRAPIIKAFEGKDETGKVRKKSLEGYPNWMDSYEKLLELTEKKLSLM